METINRIYSKKDGSKYDDTYIICGIWTHAINRKTVNIYISSGVLAVNNIPCVNRVNLLTDLMLTRNAELVSLLTEGFNAASRVGMHSGNGLVVSEFKSSLYDYCENAYVIKVDGTVISIWLKSECAR